MIWYCFARIVLTLHTGAYFPTWRLLVSFWFRSILVKESTVGDIIFQFSVQSRYFSTQHSEPLFFRVNVRSIDVQSQHSEAFRAIIFQSQHSEHRLSESAFRVEEFRAIIFQRRSEPLFFRVSIQSL